MHTYHIRADPLTDSTRPPHRWELPRRQVFSIASNTTSLVAIYTHTYPIASTDFFGPAKLERSTMDTLITDTHTHTHTRSHMLHMPSYPTIALKTHRLRPQFILHSLHTPFEVWIVSCYCLKHVLGSQHKVVRGKISQVHWNVSLIYWWTLWQYWTCTDQVLTH